MGRRNGFVSCRLFGVRWSRKGDGMPPLTLAASPRSGSRPEPCVTSAPANYRSPGVQFALPSAPRTRSSITGRSSGSSSPRHATY